MGGIDVPPDFHKLIKYVEPAGRELRSSKASQSQKPVKRIEPSSSSDSDSSKSICLSGKVQQSPEPLQTFNKSSFGKCPLLLSNESLDALINERKSISAESDSLAEPSPRKISKNRASELSPNAESENKAAVLDSEKRGKPSAHEVGFAGNIIDAKALSPGLATLWPWSGAKFKSKLAVDIVSREIKGKEGFQCNIYERDPTVVARSDGLSSQHNLPVENLRQPSCIERRNVSGKNNDALAPSSEEIANRGTDNARARDKPPSRPKPVVIEDIIIPPKIRPQKANRDSPSDTENTGPLEDFAGIIRVIRCELVR